MRSTSQVMPVIYYTEGKKDKWEIDGKKNCVCGGGGGEKGDSSMREEETRGDLNDRKIERWIQGAIESGRPSKTVRRWKKEK